MKEYDFIKMSIPAKADYVGMVRLTMSGIANRMGFTYEDIEDLKVAVSEAITNAVTHAYESEEVGEISLGFGVYKDKLEVMVADSGESFDFEEIKSYIGPYENDESVEDMREGGFGIFLIKALMDKVEIINDKGNIVYMTKYLNETGVGLNDDQVPTAP